MLQSKLCVYVPDRPLTQLHPFWRYLIHICRVSGRSINCKSTLPQLGVCVNGWNSPRWRQGNFAWWFHIKIHVIYPFQWLMCVNVTQRQWDKLLTIGDGLMDTSSIKNCIFWLIVIVIVFLGGEQKQVLIKQITSLMQLLTVDIKFIW